MCIPVIVTLVTLVTALSIGAVIGVFLLALCVAGRSD
jgi:hypothetical protein